MQGTTKELVISFVLRIATNEGNETEEYPELLEGNSFCFAHG
jgi:hypothetical protein